jgi:hypothetical protein
MKLVAPLILLIALSTQHAAAAHTYRGAVKGLPATPLDCAAPWGDVVVNGTFVTAYQDASVSAGESCAAETRACVNGLLTGTFTEEACEVSAPVTCALPWGGSIQVGASVTAYAITNVACTANNTCQAGASNSVGRETRTCLANGTLTGSYMYGSCTYASKCASCGVVSPKWSAPVFKGVCIGYLPPSNHGYSRNTVDSSGSPQGSASYQCMNGNWQLLSHPLPPTCQ